MTVNDLAYGQRVIWTNRTGNRIPARVVNIVHRHNEAQIRVTHQGGAQLLWVRPDALEDATGVAGDQSA